MPATPILRTLLPLALFSLVACQGGSKAESEEAAVSARVTFHIPLLGEDGTLLSAHNAELAKAGLAAIPDYVTVDESNGMVVFDKWYDYIGDAQAKVASLPRLLYGEDLASFGSGLCYEGDGTKVGFLTESLAGSFLGEQLYFYGWRYKDKFYRAEENDLPIWREWRGNGEAVLILYAFNDGGDRVQADIVPRCRISPQNDEGTFASAVATQLDSLPKTEAVDFPFTSGLRYAEVPRAKQGAFSKDEAVALFAEAIEKTVGNAGPLGLGYKYAEISSGEVWFAHVGDSPNGKKLLALGEFLGSGLRNFKAYRFSNASFPITVAGGAVVVTLFVGTLPSGKAVAVYGTSVEY